MNKSETLQATEKFVRETLEGAEAGHDWWHIQRVVNNARLISATEEGDPFIVELGALLHDIADAKFHGGDDELGPSKARNFLSAHQLAPEIIDHVEQIIRNISFKGGYQPVTFHSQELAVVQDADRLDAIGAIGIARAFHYGGYKNREIYNPSIPPNLQMDKDAYRKSTAPTLNHFYEKLLLLKERMQTPTGKKLAAQRHEFMEEFLRQFYMEWNGQRA
ncbi:MAG: HD domain-containing protein, partial [Bacteroidota bacterium]|nr:HD domain-containing protein [Bacteroidota bacterium]